MNIRAKDAWAVRSLLVGVEPGEHAGSVSERFAPIFERLRSQAQDQRLPTWEAFLLACPDRDAIVAAVANADPTLPPPEDDGPRRPANLADLGRLINDVRWVWDGWIPTSRIVGIAAYEGIGKSRFALDLARRIYHGMPWPDGKPATFPPGTSTLWLCADGNQDDLYEAVSDFGLPLEAVHLNALPEDPYGNTSLDDPETLQALNEFIPAVRPGLVFIDTLSNSTRKDICRQSDLQSIAIPLKDIAQQHQVTIITLLHLSKDGQALGRRIKGVTRTLLHLDQPDPENQPGRLKLWVEKSYSRKPEPLGITMGTGGNEYDGEPPQKPEGDKGGRPPESRDKARAFLVASLQSRNDQRLTGLLDGFIKSGGSKNTFFRARDELIAEGRIVCDGKPMIMHLVNVEPPKDETLF